MALALNLATTRYLMKRLGGRMISTCRHPLQQEDDGDCGDSTQYVSYIFPAQSVTWFECRKFKHAAPEHDVEIPFDGICGIPNGVFRDTTDEQLGPCAHKYGCYKNPEYFAYHHMSFYDFQHYMSVMRVGQPESGRKC